ncbi:MAG: RNA polymerase-binding protein DksA [Xanthomonadales bacterium]|nr:RNA polymerase-binding protein DksA [Xanthomonadales bacterium]MBN8795100.1 RNA polymerase-binding protein DksA [Stenotrophomonas nitritireducens]
MRSREITVSVAGSGGATDAVAALRPAGYNSAPSRLKGKRRGIPDVAAKKPAKKPTKPAAKAASAKKPAPARKPVVKPAAKKAAVKKAAPAKKAVVAKKPAPAKKPAAKPVAKKAVAAKKPAAIAKKPAAKPVAPVKKAVAKPAAKKPAPAKKPVAKPAPTTPRKDASKPAPPPPVKPAAPKTKPEGKVMVAVKKTSSGPAVSRGKVKVVPYQVDEATGRPIVPPGYKPSPDEEYMNPLMLEYFRQRLLQWRAELVEESKQTIENLKEEVRDIGDEAERATRETENSLELRTRDRYRKLIGKIDSTLKRMDNGEYGYCVDTGEEIGLERMEARLTAERTIDAQERWEHTQKLMGD